MPLRDRCLLLFLYLLLHVCVLSSVLSVHCWSLILSQLLSKTKHAAGVTDLISE